MSAGGEPIARGRSADIYDAGPGRVLRRNREHDVAPGEATAMRLAEAAGFPVPHVFALDGPDMVLERIDGPDMITVLGRRPWRVRRYGRMLADLHVRMRSIAIDAATARADLRGDEPVEALVHGDLHPGNVLITASGPVVIDWEGAHLGPDDADVATTWLLAEIADLDDVPPLVRPIVGFLRRQTVATLLRHAGRPRPATVRSVCDGRLGDPHMQPAERERIVRFRERHGTGGDAAEAP